MSTAPVDEPTALSFTIPLTGNTIVATAAVVTTYSVSADCSDSATPTCRGRLRYDVVWWWKFHSRWCIRFSSGYDVSAQEAYSYEPLAAQTVVPMLQAVNSTKFEDTVLYECHVEHSLGNTPDGDKSFTNWDDVEKIGQPTFHDEFRVVPKEQDVLLVSAP